MKGKLIIIEGSDGSGKETQTEKLFNRLREEGYKVKKVEYPNYKSESSALVKMYLRGDFGSNPEDVNPYVSSSFYAVDRFASYKTEWESFYNEGGIVIADRYTTANMIHQASKIKDEEERERFLQWLWDFEFNKFSLPIPQCVIFLDIPVEFSKELMKKRSNKITGDKAKDIHENNYEYLLHSYNTSCFISEKYKWNRICCVKDGRLKSIEEIHEEIYDTILKHIH